MTDDPASRFVDRTHEVIAEACLDDDCIMRGWNRSDGNRESADVRAVGEDRFTTGGEDAMAVGETLFERLTDLASSGMK